MAITRSARAAYESSNKHCAQCGKKLTVGKIFSHMPAVLGLRAELLCSARCAELLDGRRRKR